MDQHYRAFISYKHAPADSAVAAEIQKRLEHYHIPAAIRKKTGQDKIGRIFRDKEELPITSDLGDTISNALEDAEYLIVVCSSSTKLSAWVPREIELFLKTHSKKQVFTVLVDGEPSEVIPEQLLTDTVTKTDPDGNVYEEEVTYEPLSCDFRAGLKEAKRTEISRLAAALLGCTYDELARREHQYKRRRNLAIGIPAAFILAIAVGYLLWSRQVIAKNYQRAQEEYQRAEENYQLAQENYQKSEENYQEAQENLTQSLINQSNYLASESGKQMANGDRFAAIRLALNALPDPEAEENSLQAIRPVTLKAKLALASALCAYVPEGRTSYENSTMAVAEFPMEHRIYNYFGTDDGHYVIIEDTVGNIGVWDTESFSRTMLIESEFALLDVQLISDTQIVLLFRSYMACYDLMSGQELWRFNDQKFDSASPKMYVSTEKKIIWLGRTEANKSTDSTDTYSIQLLGIDASSGDIVYSATIIENAEKEVHCQSLSCSEDGRWVAVTTYGVFGKTPVQVYLFDTVTASCIETPLNREYYKVYTMEFLEADSNEGIENNQSERVVIMALPLEKYDQGAYTWVVESNYATITQPMEIAISCYDISSMNLIWENSYFCSQLPQLSEDQSLVLSEKTGDLVSLYGNKVAAIRVADGKILGEAETTAPIVSRQFNAKGSLILNLENGEFGVYNFNDLESIGQIPVFSFDIDSFSRIKRYGEDEWDYLVSPEGENEKCVWLCREVYDEDFTPYTGPVLPEDTLLKKEIIVGDTLIIQDTRGNLYLYDLSEQHSGSKIDAPEEYYGYSILGSNDITGTVWLQYGGKLYALNVSDGTMQEFTGYISSPTILPDDTIVDEGYDYDNEKHCISTVSIQDGVLKETLLPGRFGSLKHYSVQPNLKTAIIELYDDKEASKIQLVDLTTGELTPLGDVLSQTMEQVVWQDYGEEEFSADAESNERFLAITDGEEVVVLKTDGTEIARLSSEGFSVVNMTTYGNELLVLYGGGQLIRYSWTDGMIVNESNLTQFIGLNESFAEDVSWIFEGDKLYLVRPDAYILQIVNLETWKEEEVIQKVVAYDKARDRIISCSIDESGEHMGYFRHYSVEDLRQKAQEVLSGINNE